MRQILASIIFLGLVFPATYVRAEPVEVKPNFNAVGHLKNPKVVDIMARGQLGGTLHPHGKIKSGPHDGSHTQEAPVEAADNLEFGQAMDLWNSHNYKDASQLLKQYSNNNPEGLWTGEADLHLGCEARFNGRYREAGDIFTSLVERYTESEDLGSRLVAEKAKGRLAVLRVLQNSSEQAQEIFTDLADNAEDWRTRTYASHWLQRLSRMEKQGEALADCGSRALSHILAQDGRHEEAMSVVSTQPKTELGFNLADLEHLSEGYGYSVTALKAGIEDISNIPLPSIAQIDRSDVGGLGHYWVVESLVDDTVTLYDAQKGRRFKQTLSEFEKEWDGNLLVFSDSKKLPGRVLAKAEAEQIFGGCCGVQRPEEELGPPEECDISSNGCPDWMVNKINMNLYVTDTPIWYTPAYGPKVEIKLSYNSQSSLARNEIFGNKWSFKYGGYVVEDPGNRATVFHGNGRRAAYVGNSDGTYTTTDGSMNHLYKTGPTNYELHFADGTIHYYAIPQGTTSQQPFLVQIIDAKGYSLDFEYDADVNLSVIIDAQGERTELTYDTNRHVTSVSDPFGREARFEYDANGNLITITDMGGYTSTLTYDRNVYVSSITKPSSGTWLFYIEPADGRYSGKYSASGSNMWANYRVTITNPEGQKEQYFYDGWYGYSFYIAPRDFNHTNHWANYYNSPKTRYYFNRSGTVNRIYQKRYPDGEVVDDTYDPYGNKIFSTDGLVRIRQIFNTSNQKIAVVRSTDSGNQHVIYYEYLDRTTNLVTREQRPSVAQGKTSEKLFYYDEQKNLIESVHKGFAPTGEAVEQRYQYLYEDGRLITVDGARTDLNDVTQYRYHTCNSGEIGSHCARLAAITNALGHTTTFDSYTLIGKLEKSTDPNGMVTRYEYDDLGRVIRITKIPADSSLSPRVITMTYEGPKRLKSVVMTGGKALSYQYDSENRRTEVSDNTGNRIVTSYDANGNILREQVLDPTGQLSRTVSYMYDLRDRKTHIVKGDGTSESEYYRHGRLSVAKDANGHSTHYHYDSFGRQHQISPPEGAASLTYQYDVNGKIVSVAQDNGPTTLYEYDDLGNLLKEVSPDRSETRYSYNAAGKLVEKIDARGEIVSYSYDALNRLASIRYSNGGFVEFAYDINSNGIGRLSSVTDSSGVTNYSYNPFGQIVNKQQYIDGGIIVSLTTKYEYDAAGQLAAMIYPSGMRVGYRYNSIVDPIFRTMV